MTQAELKRMVDVYRHLSTEAKKSPNNQVAAMMRGEFAASTAKCLTYLYRNRIDVDKKLT